MKKILSIVFFIIVFLVFSIIGYNNLIRHQSKNPQNVVEDYFNFMNKKNISKFSNTLSEKQKANRGNINFNSLENIKIISINEETNSKYKDGYLNNGSGETNGVTKENVKVYQVKYEVKYKKGAITAQDSGTYTEWFWVIRKNRDLPWVIDDTGV